MPDFRSMYEKEFVYAYDLDGKDVTVTMERVQVGELVGTSGKKTKKPVVYFKGSPKGLALCVTNGRTIAAMYGNKTEAWIGKRITMFPTTTQFGGAVVECIRIRPSVPAGKGAPAAPPPEEHPAEPRQPGEEG